MNIASGPAVPIAFPPPTSALAQSAAAPQGQAVQGQAAQGPTLLDAFLSLLDSFVAQVDPGDEITPGALTPGAAKAGPQNKKDDKKESLAALFAAVQAPQAADAKAPLTLAFSLATPQTIPLTEVVPPNGAAIEATADAAVVTTGLVNPQGVANEPPVLPSLQFGPLASAPLQMPKGSDVRAPIAFALRLEEAVADATATTRQVSTPVDNGSLQQAPRPVEVQAQQQPQFLPSTSESENTMTPAVPATPAIERSEPLPAAPVAAETEESPSQATASTRTQVAEAPVQEPNAAETGAKIAKDPNPARTRNDRGAERSTESANTEEQIRRPAHAESSQDETSSKHDDRPDALPVPHTMSAEVRAEPGFTTEAAPAPRPLIRTDLQPIATQETDVRDTGALARPQPTREISMRLTPVESPTVDITLVDRGGSVHVAVRTPDTDLAHNLQSGLSELVHRLERKGFETETWSPSDAGALKTASSGQANNNDSAFDRSSRDPRDAQQQGSSGQQNQGRNRPKWVAELEQRLATGTLE